MAAPTNDDFDAATVVSTLPFTESVAMDEATAAEDDPSCWIYAESVWYRYTPTADGPVVFTAAGSSYPVIVSVWTGSRGALSNVACAFDPQPGQVRVEATAGETLYVKCEGPIATIEAPTLVFTAKTPDPAPPNDDFDAAIPIATLPFTHTTNEIYEATVAADDPITCNFGTDSKSIWYAYTNGGASPVRLALNHSGGGFNLDAYAGMRGSLTKYGCNTPYFPVSGFIVEVPPGERLSLALTQVYGPGPYTLTADVAPPGPANDDFDDAAPLAVGGEPAAADLTNAAIAFDDPGSSFSHLLRTAWWRFTPAADGEVEVYEEDAGAVLRVYTGARGALTEVASGSNLVRVPVRAGVPYHVLGSAVVPSTPARVGVRPYEPLQGMVTVDPIATYDRRSNMVTVSGTLTTNKRAGVGGCGLVEQRSGRMLLGSGSLCIGRDPFTGTVTWRETCQGPAAGFAGGNANVRLDLDFQDLGGESRRVSVSAPVRLKSVR